MIELSEIKEIENISHSTIVTYPRTVQISHGVYDNVVDMMNMTTMISQNIANDELTNVYGGKTPWGFFDNTPEFKRFMEYIVNKHQTTNPFFNKDRYRSTNIKFESWGNELKSKGDHVKMHHHIHHHLILYLTDGNPLILPELKMKIYPKRGSYYVFPPLILHGVEEVSGNDSKRYCLVCNIKEEPDWIKNKQINDFLKNGKKD